MARLMFNLRKSGRESFSSEAIDTSDVVGPFLDIARSTSVAFHPADTYEYGLASNFLQVGERYTNHNRGYGIANHTGKVKCCFLFLRESRSVADIELLTWSSSIPIDDEKL